MSPCCSLLRGDADVVVVLLLFLLLFVSFFVVAECLSYLLVVSRSGSSCGNDRAAAATKPRVGAFEG